MGFCAALTRAQFRALCEHIEQIEQVSRANGGAVGSRASLETGAVFKMGAFMIQPGNCDNRAPGRARTIPMDHEDRLARD